jgi:hypothetical protein
MGKRANRPRPAEAWNAGQPNELDLSRIARVLERRRRYRYVSPRVVSVSGGYRIESPCCSRNVDPEGGIIDVALLIYDDQHGCWRLFCKDHQRQSWELHSVYSRLHELLDGLNSDVDRAFWQ